MTEDLTLCPECKGPIARFPNIHGERVCITPQCGWRGRVKFPLRQYRAMPDTEGGSDFEAVFVGSDGLPVCIHHGAMNKVSSVFWRCLMDSTRCRAGCIERRSDDA